MDASIIIYKWWTICCWCYAAINDGTEWMDYPLLHWIIVIKAWWAKNTIVDLACASIYCTACATIRENFYLMNCSNSSSSKNKESRKPIALNMQPTQYNNTELQIKNECRKLCTPNHHVNSVFSIYLLDLFFVVYFIVP